MTATLKTAKPAKRPAKKVAPAEPLSALEAAERVLKETNRAMRVGELIDEMASRKLWVSPGGKTPAATLYAALIREIADKGKASRFKKTQPGLFTLRTNKKGGA